MNKKGFISTSVIYTLLIICLLMLMMVLLTYYNNRMLLTELKDDLRYYLYTEYSYNNADITFYFWAENEEVENDYILVDDIPSTTSYTISDYSCQNISLNEDVLGGYSSNKVTISLEDISKGRIECNFYYEKR